jgi:hypothetical protein
MLRLIGKIIAGAAAAAATTYLGNKFLEWAGVLETRYRTKKK